MRGRSSAWLAAVAAGIALAGVTGLPARAVTGSPATVAVPHATAQGQGAARYRLAGSRELPQDQSDGIGTSPSIGFNDVSCSSSTDCVAVGSAGETAVLQHWNGSTWTAATLTGLGEHSQLDSVSCPAADACVAVGWYGTSFSLHPLAYAWNGSTWRAIPGVHGNSNLSGVSCLTATDCMAVGGTDGDYEGLAAHWDGQTWTQRTEYGFAGGPGQLDSVNCLSTTFCMALGGGYIDDYDAVAFSGVWNGHTWGPMTTITEYSFEPFLNASSCGSPTVCMTPLGYQTMGQWDGNGWETDSTPPPPGYDGLGLSGVTCLSATDCLAVGEISKKNQLPQGITEQWTGGSTWHLHTVTSPGAPFDLESLSCLSSSSCVSVGIEIAGAAHEVGLTEIDSGGTWRIPPLPAGYDIQSADGGTSNFHTSFYGSQNGEHTGVGIATDPATGGYWILTANGGVSNYQAPWYGSQNGSLPAGAKPVAIADDPATGGYWILDSNGGVSNYRAPWYGSLKGHLTSPVTGIVADPATGGYWILTANGGVSNYHAPWYGSERGHVTGTAVSLAADPATGGYWILDSQGGVSNFHAPWYGSERGHLTAPIVALTTAPQTGGYWILNATGGVSNYHAPWYGSLTGTTLTSPLVGLSGQ